MNDIFQKTQDTIQTQIIISLEKNTFKFTSNKWEKFACTSLRI